MAWQTIVSPEHAATRLIDPRLRVFDCRYELANRGTGAGEQRPASTAGTR